MVISREYHRNQFSTKNVSQHVAYAILNSLSGLNMFPEPSTFPELYFIKHVWHVAGRQLQGMVQECKDLEVLYAQVNSQCKIFPRKLVTTTLQP
ncbi:hypothetical protein CDAR_570201 [Caerostris darwini]|uniref:Uncharacterized protein n=1 Tax=Caerostris darwini TaxID=1538125 RepID=A0AAV4SRZ3_9ARAC|nr:hypothetical protein CDAR_570201 [Caerostris darwini]